MSEEIIPDVRVSDAESETAGAEKQEKVNYAEKTLAELVSVFEEFAKNAERLKLAKEAEAIKSAFYKKLQKEKASLEETAQDVLVSIENGFKAYYEAYRKERAEYNAKLEKEREENLAAKEAVIADLKALLEKQEDVNATFPAFREIQDRWRAIGQVPVQRYKDINDTYQLYVEQFYDMVKINRELRDLDFKKNLEAKEKFCEIAEKLAENDNIVDAFNKLQKLHEQWKEFGPVAKQYRDEIWEHFKATTSVINKKYQAYFEEQKEKQAANLAAKTALCEKVEEIAGREISASSGWSAGAKEIEEIQKEWKTIGFASKKENQKIYDRFRAACDRFYDRKREFHSEYKDSMNANLEKKIALCEAAEELKGSTEWKKATEQFIELQNKWKEIGAVPRKKSEQIWKRFRAACDEFFNEKAKNAKSGNDYFSNLRAKKKLVAEISAYVPSGDAAADEKAMYAFIERWQGIGFVPFKEKEAVNKAYREAMRAKFPDAPLGTEGSSRSGASEKDRLVQKYSRIEQDIVTYENNIGFFARSKNSEAIIAQMQERIAQAKEELKALELRIREMEKAEE